MSPALADPSNGLQSVAGLTDAAPAAAGIVSDDETVLLMIRPSPWFIAATTANALPAAIAAGAALALATLDRAIPWYLVGAVFASLAILLARAAWQSVDWFLRLYVLTDRRIVVRRGAVPEIFECALSEVAGVGKPRRWIERVAATGSLAIMRGPSKRSRRARRFAAARSISTPPGARAASRDAPRHAPKVRVDPKLEWSVIVDSESVRRTILAAVARYR